MNKQAYDRWWNEEGSAMRPLKDEDAEAHVHRITEIAWANGSFRMSNDVEALTNSIGAIMAYLLTQEQSFKADMVNGKITDEVLERWGIRAEVKGDHIQLLI